MRSLTRVFERIDPAVERLFRWDERMVEFLSEQPFLRRLSPLFLTATILGDGYIWGVLGLGLIMFGRPVDRMNVLIGLAVSIVNVMMFRFLKLVFSRERPIPVEYTLRSRMIDTYSFPSGHATTSFGLAWVVVTSYPHPLVGLGVYLVAALISFSRVFVREHYPLDVLFGAVLGSLIAAYFDPLFRWLTF